MPETGAVQSSGSVVLSLVGGLLLFALVLALAWFCSRWLGGRYGFQSMGRTIRVLERVMVGPDRSLLVVRTGEQVWLLGCTPQHIEKIGELDPAQYPQGEGPDTGNAPDFSAALQSAIRGWIPGKKQGNGNEDE